MGLFSCFRKKKRETNSYDRIEVPQKGDIITEGHFCSERKQIEILQNSNATIVGIDRSGGCCERTLTVLFYDENIGYFCVQQSSGAYSGLGFRYLMLPSNISKPDVKSLIDAEGYSSWIANQFFSEAFEMDIYGKHHMCCDENQNVEKI